MTNACVNLRLAYFAILFLDFCGDLVIFSRQLHFIQTLVNFTVQINLVVVVSVVEIRRFSQK